MIDGIFKSNGISVLERVAQFAGARHRLIVNNIANLDTPGYRPVDVSVKDFQEQLGEAVDGRRAARGRRRELTMQDTEQVEVTPRGLRLHPTPLGDNILFHDGNDRDLERTMQSLVENFMTFRLTTELMHGRFALINTAIRERI